MISYSPQTTAFDSNSPFGISMKKPFCGQAWTFDRDFFLLTTDSKSSRPVSASVSHASRENYCFYVYFLLHVL